MRPSLFQKCPVETANNYDMHAAQYTWYLMHAYQNLWKSVSIFISHVWLILYMHSCNSWWFIYNAILKILRASLELHKNKSCDCTWQCCLHAVFRLRKSVVLNYCSNGAWKSYKNWYMQTYRYSARYALHILKHDSTHPKFLTLITQHGILSSPPPPHTHTRTLQSVRILIIITSLSLTVIALSIATLILCYIWSQWPFDAGKVKYIGIPVVASVCVTD